MDNHFVPNLTFGPLLVRAVRRLSRAFVDVHLMVERPESLIARFREAGADAITVHVEACEDPGATLAAVRSTGAQAGITLRPGTPFERVEPWLGAVDLLLVMTVEPGFGGQPFMAGMLDKVRAAREWRTQRGGRFLIEVDGGIAPATAPLCRAAGADVFVAGEAVYRQPDPKRALAELRDAIR
jgi:ribulose-phosphate 3-epimerase